ncbi:helix-turn-helix transcriptional regulator [Dactylosporangium sp. NPDC049525]|uniref:helix-turn-helix transcriptional regulator n=1 Tax=Dactylosporangium sp. NPDC049525 TaxID=3154730 RepID=UPI0034314803
MIDPAAISQAKQALGRKLADCREAADLNQHQLAPLIQYTRSTIANAETGHSTTSRAFWQRCDEALSADGDLLRSYDELKTLARTQQAEHARALEAKRVAKFHNSLEQQPPVGIDAPSALSADSWSSPTVADTVDDVKRRTALLAPVLSLFGAAGLAEPWSRLAYVLDQPGQLDELTLEHLEGSTAELYRREQLLPSRRLVTHLDAHVSRLERLLGRAPDAFARRVAMTTGEALALAGWVAWDSRQIHQAHILYGSATAAARQAGDGPLYACVLAYRSYAAEANGDLPHARKLLVEAQNYVRGERSATTRAWLAAREAEVDAALGDETPALRALDRAMTAYDYARPHRERAWTSFLTPSRLGGMAVTAYARLGHPELDVLTESVLASLAHGELHRKAIVLADVAAVAIQRGDHDRGAELGHEALDEAATRETRLIDERLSRLREATHSKRHIPALAELDDRLAACT